MYHDVEKEPLPFFLREANLKKFSGHLFVSAKDFQITLNLLEGKLANGMSTRFDEKLSVILHLMGGINEEQYNFLSGLHQFSDDQVAGILLDYNFAKKKDIFYARIYQLRRIAISTFALQRGKWIFTAGEADPPLRETFDIPLAGILIEGARSVDHISLYASRWLHGIPVLFKEIPMDIEIYFTDAEREFYAAVQAQGRRSCQELIARLNLLPIIFWRSLLAFHLLGIVEFERGDEAPDLSGEIAALLELNRKLGETASAGAALLGLSASAPASEFEKTKAGLLARFSPDRFGSGAAPEIKGIARVVCSRLQELVPGPEAWQDAATRSGLAPDEDLVIDAVQAAVPGLLREEDIVIESPQGSEPELLIEADRIREPEVPAAAEPPVQVAAEDEPLSGAEWIIQEDEQAGPGAAPFIALQVEPDLQAGPQPPAEPESPIEHPLGEFAPVAAPPSLRMANPDHEKAWELLLQAKEHYEKHEYVMAVPLLKKAIRLEPGQGDFYYLLGLCQGEAQVTMNEAEMNLKKAIELKSWSADPVYALGVLYRHQGKMKLAERCFQRVKEIAYEHTGASRAIVDLRRQKTTGKPLSPTPKKKRS